MAVDENRSVPVRERDVLCMGPHGLHRIAYREWGNPEHRKVLMCVHALTRNSHDFDFLARALADHYRVICPDVAGRGHSDRLRVADDYVLPTYANDMITLIARLDVEQVDWVGTSMGGLIGMVIASQPGSPIRRMALSDVGPLITAEAIQRIGDYVGMAPKFASVEEVEQYIRVVAAPFGRLPDAHWRHLAEHAVRPAAGGGFEMNYDAAIAEPFRKLFVEIGKDVDLWPVYDAVSCPTLLLRGAESDLLTHATAVEMTRRGPKARLVEIQGVGHAPMMLDDYQIEVVRNFLLEQ